MFKKTMKFDDLDGNEMTQTFHFNYNKKEIAELLEFGEVQQFRSGREKLPLEAQMKLLTIPVEESGLSQQANSQQAYDIFQDLLLNAYGVKGEDNVTFKKSLEQREYWESHVAFIELVFEMLEDTALFNDFIMGCLPANLVSKVKADMAEQGTKVYTDEEIAAMTRVAAERQADPETRIEPGPKAAAEALNTEIMTEGKTDAEILASKPLDLTHAQLLRGMELKNQS